MKTDAQSMTYIIRCKSAETLRLTMEFAKTRIRLDEEITRTFRTFPGGAERREIRTYRLRDYFDSIQLLKDESDEPMSFRLIFHIDQSADSFWKDLLMAVLRSITDHLPGVSARATVQSA